MPEQSVSVLLTEAASLMLVGMLVVFVFLTLLIFAVQGLSAFCARWLNAGSDMHHAVTKVTSATPPMTGIPPQHVAAITAAFAMRKRKKADTKDKS